MPRPQGGYKNAAGQQIPGVTDITGRFMDRSRLLYWAFNRGKAGHAKLYDDSALDIGTAVHTMAELDLKGEPQADIEFYLDATLRSADERDKARAAFRAFRAWRAEFAVEAERQELSLVSERLQFGGTLDTLARIRRGRGILDFKTTTSGEVYEDHVLQLAAYGILWEENFPELPLDEGYHLILLPKDGSRPIHRAFTHAALHVFRQKFWLYRKAHALDADCNRPETLHGGLGAGAAPTAASEKPKAARRSRAKVSEKASEKAPVTAAPVASPFVRAPRAIPAQPASMAEVLRRYGHVGAPA